MAYRNHLFTALIMLMLFSVLSFLTLIFVLPVFGDGIWVNEVFDAFAKVALVSLLPVALFTFYLSHRSSIELDTLFAVFLVILIAASYSFAQIKGGSEKEVLVSFVTVYIAVPSLLMMASSIILSLIQKRRMEE
ncbi:MAG: hypothetical protein SPJ34_02195 [Candidatus Ornithospirochaeta sp.]|nr:hypothetical protein [Candidatus Ornithospirochaeta sp.]